MTKPTIQIGDEVREMTDEETEQHLLDVAYFATLDQAAAKAADTRASALAKLKALGLTDAEVAALTGA